MYPSVTGLMQLPSTFVTRPSSIVTSSVQASGQSSGHALCTTLGSAAAVMSPSQLIPAWKLGKELMVLVHLQPPCLLRIREHPRLVNPSVGAPANRLRLAD